MQQFISELKAGVYKFKHSIGAGEFHFKKRYLFERRNNDNPHAALIDQSSNQRRRQNIPRYQRMKTRYEYSFHVFFWLSIRHLIYDISVLLYSAPILVFPQHRKITICR